jgi:outer membrane protein OmpA-like peptidoglycan-associated protein
MFRQTHKTAFYTMLLGVLLALSAQFAFAQEDQTNTVRPRRVTKATSARTIPSGQEVEITGNITKADENSFSICNMAGAETVVQLTGSTRITTHRRGILRGAKSHDKSALLLGLLVTVKGRGNESGELVAKYVRFHDSNLKAATIVDARAVPIEKEQDRMAGQLDETTIVASSARKEAKAAQDSADKAQSAADQAQNTADLAKASAAQAQQIAVSAHEKIAAIDDFETTEDLAVNFRVGSAVLTKEAKEKLDAFVAKTSGAKGYVIEISGFTSKEGGYAYNRRLGEARAEAVLNYLVDTGKVAQRRIVAPYSGGENNPIADNSTREGRMQNRRAEVKLLVSKGLAAKEPVATSTQ